jgi:hypothetical protein
MTSYPYIRAVIRASVCVAALVGAPVSFGSAAGRVQAEAQLLDHAEFLCDNCFFGPSTYYYCFAADNQVLIGYQRTPVLNWQDKSKNYLTAVHSTWAAWTAPGQTVPISYDEKHLWVSRGDTQASRDFWAHLKAVAKWVTRDDSKQVRLTRGTRDVFTNDRCREAGRAKAH